MVFQTEAHFQQFTHCKFRENVIRVLYIPSLENGMIFLVVDKFGKIGIYDSEHFTLLHSYLLELTVPMHPNMSKNLLHIAKYEGLKPKCQATHLVSDAIYAPDLKMVIFATTKYILQCYDIGEIEGFRIGLEIFPRKEALGVKPGQRILKLGNKGHVETHRIFGLPEVPNCMEYFEANPSDSGFNKSKIFIGDLDGAITIITIDNLYKPFGFRKIRGVLHEIKIESLISQGNLHTYKAHIDIVKELRFIPSRKLIISCSKDSKFSLFIKDYTEAVDPYIVSLPKVVELNDLRLLIILDFQGVNAFAISEKLKIIATGSDDGILRLFNEYALTVQMELYGHKTSIIGIKFISVPFSDNPILLSYSTNVELRAWDPISFICIQSIYISFPLKSNLLSKPEFAKRPLFIHQPHYSISTDKLGSTKGESQPNSPSSSDKGEKGEESLRDSEDSSQNYMPNYLQKGKDGLIILLYCNSYAKLFIEKDTSSWPFDFDDFVTEFEEMSINRTKKHRRNESREISQAPSSNSKDPRAPKLTLDEIQAIESKLDEQVTEILRIKRAVDKHLDPISQFGPSNPSTSLSTKAVQRYFKLRDQNTMEGQLFKTYGSASKSIPLQEIHPLTFSRSPEILPMTQLMKKYLQTDHLTSIKDLFTEDAKKCLSQKNLTTCHIRADIAVKTFPIKPPSPTEENVNHKPEFNDCNED